MNNNRRHFMKQLITASATGIALPLLASSKEPVTNFELGAGEAYWEKLKGQFSIAPNKIMMNAANLCPSPNVIRDKVMEYHTALNSNVSFQYRALFASIRKKSITQLAQFVGADESEVGITRNTSEANCTIVHGLDFKQGDEIIIWEQNHPSNREIWMSQAKRFGFTVIKVAVPANPKTKNDLVEPFEKAITSKTKLISFSHISNLSGIAMPAKEICMMANAKGIMTMVDGAQSLGMTNINLHELGCTFYTASTHKWLMGSFENGLLYIQKDSFNKVWPNIVGGGWKDSKTVDENLCVLGQRNETSPAAIPEALGFYETIGRKKIEERVIELSTFLKTQIQSKIPQAQFVTPLSPELSGGIVIINLPNNEFHEVYDKLYSNYGIATAPSGGIRLSPHIYNTLKDVDVVVDALKEISK